MIAVSSRDLNAQIRIQYKITTKDADGFPITVWRDLGSDGIPTEEKPRWAKWQWVHGSEYFQAAAVQSKAVAEVTIRYLSGVLPNMRVLYKDKAYNILPPIDNVLERKRYIVFKVEGIEEG